MQSALWTMFGRLLYVHMERHESEMQEYIYLYFTEM